MHKDVEYQVSGFDGDGSRDMYFNVASKAMVQAMEVAMATGHSHIDVLISSKFGARHFGGEDAVDRYQEDPDASAFERWEFTANNVGKVS